MLLFSLILWFWLFLVDEFHDILDTVSQRIFQCNKPDEVVPLSEIFNSLLRLEIILILELFEWEIPVRESDCSVSFCSHVTPQYSFHVVLIRNQFFGIIVILLLGIIHPIIFETFHWEDFLVFIV